METPVPIYITLPAEYFPVNVGSMLEIDMGKQEQVSAVTKTVGKKPIVVASAPSEKRPMPLSVKKPLAPAEPRSSVGSDDDECSSMDELMSRGKKRRLDHLTWEEKLQRKKLKNRVAAQTSRDRKKAKMEEMEKTIQEQADQISELQDRCSALAAEKSEMHGKYLSLERRFEELQRRLEAQEKDNGRAKNGILHRVGQSLAATASDDDGGSVGCATAGRLSGSAASPRCPQQQGLNKGGPAEAQTTLPPSTSDERLTALWKIIAICLLYRTCSKISTCPSSKSLPKAYSQVSAQTWKALIAQAARLMPKAAAPASACLDQWWGPQQQSWNPVDRLHCPLIREAA
uniref:X-box-binding protein 1 n=1 Tax=Anopheles atroparvus TaxID=41427 RepID=A0AAG5DKA0_ANOAO